MLQLAMVSDILLHTPQLQVLHLHTQLLRIPCRILQSHTLHRHPTHPTLPQRHTHHHLLQCHRIPTSQLVSVFCLFFFSCWGGVIMAPEFKVCQVWPCPFLYFVIRRLGLVPKFKVGRVPDHAILGRGLLWPIKAAAAAGPKEPCVWWLPGSPQGKT